MRLPGKAQTNHMLLYVSGSSLGYISHTLGTLDMAHNLKSLMFTWKQNKRSFREDIMKNNC